ncbi:hypothetical protein WJX73_003559 [Symbiochloris irregularis]|uniref:Septin-type G domain-containing protein n=1 Tax=Symbiochloris irregularis TaxID=706552 RepID=A0AAW1NNY8_9CHLO
MSSYDYTALANGVYIDNGLPGANELPARIRTQVHDDQGQATTRQMPASYSPVLRIPAKKATAHVNLLLAGGSNLGKTTFIKQFFHDFAPEGFVAHDGTPTPMEKFRREGGPASLCAHLPDGIPTQSEEYQLFFHIQDTPGHNGLNIAEVKDLVVKHVQSEKEAHYRLRMERQSDAQATGADVTKEGRNDRLFDLCLYFIPPQSFTQQDMDFIAELSKEVMVVPVCAKADAMTNDERLAFHSQVQDCLAAEGITYGLVEEEIGAAARNIGITSHTGPLDGPPFVVVTSNTYKQIGSELRPVRSYPWGDCVVDDPKHSDFALIRVKKDALVLIMSLLLEWMALCE